MKRLNVIALCIAVLVFVSCTNLKNKKVTEENRDKILNEISSSKDLSDEERQLLAGYIMKESLGKMFAGGKPGLPTGKTLGEMINEQKTWLAEQKAEEDRQKQLAAEVAKKQAEMRNVIGVALYSFNENHSGFMPYAEVGYAYENRSDRDVRAFDGEVVYSDVLGNKLETVPLKVLAPIKAGAKASASDRLPFMAYGGLRDKTLDNLKIEWQPKKILFVDGSTAEIKSAD